MKTCKHKNKQPMGKNMWYCRDCNHCVPQYILDFDKKFKKFMNKNV